MSETYTGQVRLGLEEFARELAQASTPPEESWHASIVEAEPYLVHERCVGKDIRVLDSLAQQLADLALTRHPGPDRRATYRFRRTAIGGIGGVQFLGVVAVDAHHRPRPSA